MPALSPPDAARERNAVGLIEVSVVSSVVHVTSWLSRLGGGIPPVIWSLAKHNRRLGTECLVAGLTDEFAQADCAVHNIPYLAARIIGPKGLGFSPELRRGLRARVKLGGVIHSHGLWMYPGVEARTLAKRVGAPLVISPHGMLEPWALANSRWKKKIAAFLFENRNLQAGDCLHALCDAEAQHIRHYGVNKPIAVIPNGIDPAEFSSWPGYQAIEARYSFLKQKRRVLFLSRIHPKKGLNHLLHAWKNLVSEFKNWHLLVAGSGQPAHEEQVRSLAGQLGIQDSVLFLGPVHGAAKKEVLAGADLFVLPSFSEGFSMAILEAAAAGLPVILTPQCNFPELVKVGGAVEAAPESAVCQQALRNLMSLKDAERKEMGSRGQTRVLQEYTWSRIAVSMQAVYQWLLGNGERPGCVRVD